MSVADANYLAALVSVLLVAAHVIYCRVKLECWPGLVRSILTYLSGTGAVSGLHLGYLLLRPRDPKAVISVDDFRTTLVIAAIAMVAAAGFGLRDNWLFMHRPKPRRKKQPKASAAADADVER